jgi:hypothetical protein
MLSSILSVPFTVMLSVVKLHVVMLSVVAPCDNANLFPT